MPDSPPLKLFLFSADQMKPLAEHIVSATRAIISDRQMSADSAKWFRFHGDEVRRYRDGLTLDTMVASPVVNIAAKVMPPSTKQADRNWLSDTRDVHVGTAALLGMIAVPDLYDRPTALAAGRAWQRIHRWLTSQGVAAQPLNQPVELVDRERERNGAAHADDLARITGDASWQPTFIFRAGYAKRPGRLSPRRPIEAVVT